MQGVAPVDRELWDALTVCGHLVPKGSVFAFLADHRSDLFPEAMFADMFPAAGGRPSVPADVMAAAIVLQKLHGLSDRDTADAVRCDLRWKIACGLALTDNGFHPTTLLYWRRRLSVSARPNRIFDVVRSVIAQTGVLAGKMRRALDSTVLEDAVATQDTVIQLIAAIRRVRREVPGAAEMIAVLCSAHDYTDPGKPAIAWNDPQARAGLIDALVGDAQRLLDGLGGWDLDAGGAEAVGLLALVAGQDVEPGEGSDGTDGRWRIARGVAADRVISVHDPDTRHVHKSLHQRTDGYKAHVAVEPDTGLVTDCTVRQASGAQNHEAAVGVQLLAGEQPGLQVLGDSAYGTAEARVALADAGHDAVIKPIPLRTVIEDGFTRDDFLVMRPPKPSPARPDTPWPSTEHVEPNLAFAAATARCEPAAPPPRTAGNSLCTSTTRCFSPRAVTPKHRNSKRFTDNTDRWSNAASPGSFAAIGNCAIAEPPKTTGGFTSASPRSTSSA